MNLLAALGVITLQPGAGITPTALDITENPENVQIVELDAGIIARSLDDLDAAVVNTDWALKSASGSTCASPVRRSTTIPTAT